ncbi:MAG: glycosyltransferase family 39 protein, partial [Patescibacteria group bacterium]|nr:glycosyltransferase family 39 protein [Patescibacteria group bacterium]
MKNKKIFLIILTGFILYLPSLFFDFSYFDDQVLILENLNFLKNLSNFWKAFETEVFHTQGFSASYYRPMLTLSFMVDAQFSGQSAFFYHLSNIIYHLIASVLVFVFLKKIKIEEKVSFFLSLIFAVHPVLVQAVSWIPGRNDSLLAVFALSSFIFLVNYLEKRRFFDLVFYFLFFALGLFTKESAILLPFFTILLISFFYQQKKNYLLEIFFGWWFIVFFWLILRQRALNNFLYLSFQEIVSALFFNSPAILLYFGKIFFPFNLSVLPILKDSNLTWGILALIIFILLAVFVKKINWKLFVFGLFWFVLFLIPNFVRPNPSIAADFLEHRIYLP